MKNSICRTCTAGNLEHQRYSLQRDCTLSSIVTTLSDYLLYRNETKCQTETVESPISPFILYVILIPIRGSMAPLTYK